MARTTEARHTLRINAGRWRGRKLPVLSRPDLRPTGARVRETLFNWLRPVIAGARCLDLYAGTGILGIEAVSEGAASAVLVEADRAVAAQIAANIKVLESAELSVLNVPVERFLEGAPVAYDIVFADPPYAAQLLATTFANLARGWVGHGSLVYTESNAQLDVPAYSGQGWEVLKTARAGRVHYYLFRRMAAPHIP